MIPSKLTNNVHGCGSGFSLDYHMDPILYPDQDGDVDMDQYLASFIIGSGNLIPSKLMNYVQVCGSGFSGDFLYPDQDRDFNIDQDVY